MSETTNTPTPIPPTNLDINDLVNAVKIIDFACDQGAFRGWDSINGVKQVRDKLSNFVDSIPKPAITETNAS